MLVKTGVYVRHVPGADVRGKGVGGFVQAAAGKIVPDTLGRQAGETVLGVHREMPAHHLALGPSPARLDRFQDPEEGHPEFLQEKRQPRRGFARLKVIQVGVTGFGDVAQGLGFLAP